MTASMAAQGGLTIAGAIANSVAQNKVSAARTKALAQQRTQQAALDSQVLDTQQHALQPFKDFSGARDANASKLADLYGGMNIGRATGPNAPTAVLPSTSSTLTRNEDAKQGGIAAMFGNQQANAHAALDATGNTLLDANLVRAKDAGHIAMLDNFKTGDANLLAGQLDAANQQGNAWKFFGDLSNGAGQIAGAALRTPNAPYLWSSTPAAPLPNFGFASPTVRA